MRFLKLGIRTCQLLAKASQSIRGQSQVIKMRLIILIQDWQEMELSLIMKT